ncbi:MAG: cation-translocating P-type ATPase [Armatimonadota bacterium]|nr:cation-translocating P-type ATPase [Armatimonadota bacterium]
METLTLDIPVLWPNYFEDCEQCTERLRETLQGLDGMVSVRIDTDRRTVEVSYAKDLLNFEAIRQAAQELGITLAERFKHERVTVDGLDCPDCAENLEKAVSRIPGVSWVSVSFASSLLIVEYEPHITDLQTILNTIRRLGYDVRLPDEVPIHGSARRTIPRGSLRILLTALSGLLLASGLVVQHLCHNPSAGSVLLICAAVFGGVYPIRRAYFSLKGRSVDTNFLVTVAAAGAIWLGDYAEAAAVLFLFSVGSALEALSADKARKSIRSLIAAFPETVVVKRGGEMLQVHIDAVDVGEVVLVKPGERIALDGIVVSGESTVDEAPITGEPTPKPKGKGDSVYAGSINGEGALEIRTTSKAEDSTVSKIVRLVEEAQTQKAPSQRFSETVGRYYTPAVIAMAAAVAIVGAAAYAGSYELWLRRALTLLVVACPCALVVSAPVAIVCALANAAKRGVLIKGGIHLETLAEVSTVAFDKTGTLTYGKPQVREVKAFNEHTETDVIAAAAAVESRSEHPLADAVVDYANTTGAPKMHVFFFEALPGRGARAVADGEVYYVGNERLMKEIGFAPPETNCAGDSKDAPCTTVYVANERELIGAVVLSDIVRSCAAAVIGELKNEGLRRIVMLTGDNAEAARAVASQVGIREFYAELLPQDKVRVVKELASASGKVAMVGDGFNDAPALAAAHVGIAMGGLGSHASIETADVVLMADEIVMLPYALRLSRRTRAIIVQNLAFAIGTAALLIWGAITQHVTLATGVLGHEASALLVIANGMRLLKK